MAQPPCGLEGPLSLPVPHVAVRDLPEVADMQPYQELVAEAQEVDDFYSKLFDRCAALSDFLGSAVFESLSPGERTALQAQHEEMVAASMPIWKYGLILRNRIASFEADAESTADTATDA
ncbi:MAG: hypothetical protein AAFY88_08865 [Acidobacteriota bacterium]